MDHEMDGIEWVTLMVVLTFAIPCFLAWFVFFRLGNRFEVPLGTRAALWLTPLASAAFMVWVLRRWAAREVRENSGYILLLAGFGMLWITGASFLSSWFGVGLRDDAIERNNRAAAVAWCGAVMGATLAYAGGNIGEGPSLANNLFSIALAGTALAASWLAIQLVGDVATSIAVERDLPSGVRLAGFLLASGLIVGRAVAGDWHSTTATLRDFARDAWPVAPLTILASAGERILRPSRERPFPPLAHGVVPAAIYFAAAVLWLWHRGSWEGH